jgi:exodeoxyribonuclease V alpha subunit
VSIITGGGGTGKSTICRCICYLANKAGKSVRLMSPTGKAAQVLSNKTGQHASTIHRSLGLTPDQLVPKNPISEDIIVVDEVSMVGLDTMYAIMYAMSHNVFGNIVFVGDPNQLPSVSPGNFLTDIMISGLANVVKLDVIHRQDDNSFIPLIAQQLSIGKKIDIPDHATDIEWHEASSSGFADTMKGAVNDYLDAGNDINDLQVLAPMYRGECGVDKVNSSIQEFMAKRSGKPQCLELGFNKFYVGDRVIQLTNDYDRDVFNGDIGTIVDLGRMTVDRKVDDREQPYIVVDFYGRTIMYAGEGIEQLRLAWCITVHKYQGSQIKNCFFVMSNEAQRMFSKELVYTAFTRAEDRLDVYGYSGMLQLAPTRSVVKKRYTNMDALFYQYQNGEKMLETAKAKDKAKA